jgi:hypothetical protein
MVGACWLARQVRFTTLSFAPCNVHHRALELLQTDDLERLASLPLFEDRYQRLTNVTLLQLTQQLYSFGFGTGAFCPNRHQLL